VDCGTGGAIGKVGGISIVIVHHNTCDVLRECLSSIPTRPSDLPTEVIVIDNASADPQVKSLPQEFPQVRFQFNAHNPGFARASNQGIQMGQGEYAMLLNPDALIDGDGIQGMMELMKARPDVGVAAPQLMGPDGELQLSCRRFPTWRAVLQRGTRLDGVFPGAVRRYLMGDWNHESGREVDWVMGACMVLRRAALEDVGLLDEGFFMYYEDIDLCRRMWQEGWKVYYHPEVKVRHEHQRASASLLPNRLTYEHARSAVRLFRKHGFPWW